MQDDPRVAVITAAMCQGNKLEKVRSDFPDRFFDIGICESHAVAFAAGLAKAGMRPIVDIYSTFLQRGFDQIFQEVALQNLPVTFCLDRAGLTGPDGPTHHGVFDIAYMRLFPNMVVMAPGDELDVAPMLHFALGHDGPGVAALSQGEPGEGRARRRRRSSWARPRSTSGATDGMLVAYGTPVPDLRQGGREAARGGARASASSTPASPSRSTRATLLKAVEELPLVVTVEEGTLEGGFGSAVLEAANAAGLDTRQRRAPRPAGPLRRARRTRRAAGRPGAGRGRDLRHGAEGAGAGGGGGGTGGGDAVRGFGRMADWTDEADLRTN